MSLYEINQITEQIIGASIKVHPELGPWLLESAYQECLYHDLVSEGFRVEKEKPLPLIYTVELNSVDMPSEVHLAQVLTHLKLSNQKIGLLINVNVYRLKEGIKRLINKYYIPPAISGKNSGSRR